MLCFVLAYVSSCKSSTAPITKLSDIVFPDSDISYNRTIQPLFNIACATPGCHDAQTEAKNLDLTSYAALRLRFYDVVIPHDTINSRLVWSIEGRLGSVPMPPSAALLPNQIRGLKKWIMEGATDTIP